MKKLCSILLSLILVFAFLMPISVFANVKQEKVKVQLLQEGDLPDTDIDFGSSSLSAETLAEVENVLYQGMLNIKNKIYIDKYNVPTSELSLIYSNVINNHPDLFYVSSNVSWSYYESSMTVAGVMPTYTLTSKEISGQKILFDNEVNKIISLTNDTMSDVQKALVVHDYICSLAVYPNLNLGDKDIYHSAYGFVKDRNIVCAGYALMYSAIMNELNIPCRYVISDSMRHAWNAVYINNNWYNVDLTWDDTSYSSTASNKMGVYSHKYFMKSTSDFETNRNHKGMVYPNGIECNDTAYDDAFWNDNIGNIFAYNGDYYYLDIDTANFLANVIKRDNKGNTSVLNKNKYYSNYSTYSDGVNAPAGQIVMINDVIYFSTSLYGSATIYCYDLKTDKEYTITEFKGGSAGLGAPDGELMYASSDNIYTYISLKQEPIFNELYPSNVNKSDYIPYVDINHDGYINSKDYIQLKK